MQVPLQTGEYVIYKKEVQVIHRGIQTLWNRRKYEAEAWVILLFQGVWISRQNTKQVFLV